MLLENIDGKIGRLEKLIMSEKLTIWQGVNMSMNVQKNLYRPNLTIMNGKMPTEEAHQILAGSTNVQKLTSMIPL